MLRRFLVLIAVTGIVAMAAAQSPELDDQPDSASPSQVVKDQTESLLQALGALNRGDTAGSLARIDALLAMEPATSAQGAARVLRGQIESAFGARQTTWLNRKVADRVVLVEDEAAALAAMNQWTPESFWPVLIEDGWFTPIFIAAFEPAQIWRWGSDAGVEQDLAEAWQQTIQSHNEQLAQGDPDRPRPPGMVVLDLKGPQRLGGLALALGRGQPIVVMRQGGRVRHVAALPDVMRFNSELMKAAAHWKLLSADAWFGITLAGPFPYRYRVPLKENEKQKANDPFDMTLRAVDDMMGRLLDTQTQRLVRVAVVGRLSGTAGQALYQAMCGLYLQPKRMLWVDGYSLRGGTTWVDYGMNGAVERMGQRYECELLTGPQVNLEAFHRETRPINPFGMIWINSSGGSRSWQINGKAGPDDFPVGAATAMHVVHSHSLANAWNANTLAGRAVAGGAYWYYGAMAEPFLLAFNQPTGMAQRILAGTPVAFAARQMVGQMGATPWRLMLIGDPLFTLTDAHADRIELEPGPNFRPIERLGDDASAPQRLSQAVLIDRESTLPLALACVNQAEDLKADDLARAAWVLYRAGRHDALAPMSGPAVERHRMTGILLHLSRLAAGWYEQQAGDAPVAPQKKPGRPKRAGRNR